MLALSILNRRTENHDSATGREAQNRIDDLLDRLTRNRPTALGTVGLPNSCEEQAKVVVDLGDRSDRRPGVMAGAFLIDRDGRREPFDVVDVRLLHLAEKLAGVRRKR